MLIEKCFAKVYGSYEDLDSGISDEGFKIITGAPVNFYYAPEMK